jgi:chromosome partitioning protein
MTVLAVVAHRGGAGKTTVAANLGAALAGLGRRVLLVDADPQGALGAALGVRPDKPGLYEVLAGRAAAADAIRPTAVEWLALLPADLDLAGADVELVGRPDWHSSLAAALAPIAGRFGILLLDTAPGLGVLAYSALLASTHALIVCPPEFLAFRALEQVLATLERARGRNPGLQLAGIVPTMAGRRSRHEREVLDALAERHGAELLPEIPRRVAVQDAALAGQPVSLYEPRGDAAAAFHTLAREVLRRAETPPESQGPPRGRRRAPRS